MGKASGKTESRRLPKLISAAILLAVMSIVLLYVARLEAHTGVDVFLPTNYHSILESSQHSNGTVALNAIGDESVLLSYYQAYAEQNGRPYSLRQDLLLSRMAHVRAPKGYRGDRERITLGELCDEIQQTIAKQAENTMSKYGCERQELLDLVGSITDHSTLSNLVICEYFSDQSGLAGYILQSDEAITIAFMGTDDLTDKLDNTLLLPFNLSIQYPSIRALLAKYHTAERLWLTGHSKGGHNAIYAASIDDRCRATGFNSPGFGIFLSDAQHDNLDYGVNFVINGDATGFLLFHLERRIILESLGMPSSGGNILNSRHGLSSFYPIDDLTIATSMVPLSIGLEWITQIVWILAIVVLGYGVATRLCLYVLNTLR